MTRHPERAVRVNRIAAALTILGATTLLGTLTALITTLVYLGLTHTRDWHDLLNWWHPAMAALALLPIAIYAWRWNRIKIAWHFRGYHLGAEEIYLRTGLLTRRLTVLAYARIQEVNVVTGPIQRHYELATVTISTAAGREAITDIDPQTAHNLRDHLTELARKRRLPV
ncbi:PH domain-containing protein [Streptomyces sp. NPDC001890]|uniref:PH domain-containing protein n=1 Tax=Streptomyces sp. NPDC001890 TaxID=3364620 RepID=UPI00367C2F96